jgi:hypothetical protein
MTMVRHRLPRALLTALLSASAVLGTPGAPVTTAAATGSVVLVGAGDIASCSSTADRRTAGLLDEIGGTVFTTGDNAYPSGSGWQFRHCYGPTWGRHYDRTRPAVGNHEYATTGASGYFHYFGWRAGQPGRGWYTYNRGAWRIYVLNSNCSRVGGCWVGSKQERWLRAELAAHPRECVLAYWHHPRFSSGFHGNEPAVRGFWRTLHAAGADVVVNGHDHDYERFAPQDYRGELDVAHGIREFVVGSGGRELRPLKALRPNSEVANADSFGVLKLTLGDGWYRWRFVAAGTSPFTDSGTADCH